MARTRTKRRFLPVSLQWKPKVQSLGSQGGHSDLATDRMLFEDLEIAPWGTNTPCEERCHVHSITCSYLLSVCFYLVWLSWPMSSSPEDASSSRPPAQSLSAFDLGHHPVQLDSARCRKLASFLRSSASLKGVSAFMF